MLVHEVPALDFGPNGPGVPRPPIDDPPPDPPETDPVPPEPGAPPEPIDLQK
jgi:hypothetical protein